MEKVIPIYPGDPLGDDDFNCANESHTCPYRSELFGDEESLCNCSDEETKQCAEDV